jgi:hypothetical protein
MSASCCVSCLAGLMHEVILGEDHMFVATGAAGFCAAEHLVSST